MKIVQRSVTLKARPRGFHSITYEISRVLGSPLPIDIGLCQIFIQHTSASLAINEDADPTVRLDFETYFNKYVPENDPDYRHHDEGPDDMPAHLKAAILGASLMIPIKDGALALGTWQGIYLCEHRNNGGNRNILITLMGQ